MSQRLLISEKSLVTTEDNFYDCVYSEESTVQNLLDEWLLYDAPTQSYVGPFKIYIRSRNLMDQFMQDFKLLSNFVEGLSSFNDIWHIYEDDNLIHENPMISQEFDLILSEFTKFLNKKDSED